MTIPVSNNGPESLWCDRCGGYHHWDFDCGEAERRERCRLDELIGHQAEQATEGHEEGDT